MEILDDNPDGESVDTPVKPGTIRVILADSQAIYRVGIRKVFALEDDIRVVAQADSLENLRAAIERYPTDIVLLEGSMLAGTANVIPELLRLAPDVKLIVQAVAADENHTVELYRRGVRGIVSRSISPDLLVRCVRRIAAGETWIDNQSVNWVIEAYRAQAAALVSPRNQPRLSPKEMSIITCITQGKRNKEIAFQLGTTEQVIKNYLRKIYDKLGVQTGWSWPSIACTTRSSRRSWMRRRWRRRSSPHSFAGTRSSPQDSAESPAIAALFGLARASAQDWRASSSNRIISASSAPLEMPEQLHRDALNHWIHGAQQIQPGIGDLRPNHAPILPVAMLADQLEAFSRASKRVMSGSAAIMRRRWPRR